VPPAALVKSNGSDNNNNSMLLVATRIIIIATEHESQQKINKRLQGKSNYNTRVQSFFLESRFAQFRSRSQAIRQLKNW
jgi:deoxyadenosine/deoxycytidine kinase